MAVHVPLSQKAIEEAKRLMLPPNNLLRPADGSPITTPASKEMALGVYFLTSEDTRIEALNTIFADRQEAIFAYQVGKIELRQKITIKHNGLLIETTPGRILFNEILPSGFDFVNEAITSSKIKELFTRAFTTSSLESVVLMVDAIKELGFFGGTVSGLSFGIFDSKILPEKGKILKEADEKVSEIEVNYAQGLITAEEKRRLSQEVWIEVTEELADKTWNLLDETSPIRIVIDAKVGRASRDQVKQLAAIRGLVVDPLGKIVELPIKSNFREGLSVFEYVTSSRGSRKGLTDTALKTADAGYLTRRLVDVAHDVLVRAQDCGTKEGILISKATRPNIFVSRIMGRFTVNDIVTPKGKKVIIKKNEIISEDKAIEIDALGITEVIIRSPLTCQARYGMCKTCYGWDLSNKRMVEIGTPVGVVAAQSIGDPGTPPTSKTKHSGGIVGLDVTQGLPRVEELFEARTPKALSPLSEIGGKVRTAETDEGWKVTVTSVSAKPKEERDYIIPKTLKLAVDDKQLVEAVTH